METLPSLDSKTNAPAAAAGSPDDSAAGAELDAAPEHSEKGNVRPYSFEPKFVSSEEQWRALRQQHDRFAEALAARLSSYLRLECPLRLTGVEMARFQEFTAQLGASTHLCVFRIEPLSGLSVLAFSLPLALTLVDRIVGGPGKRLPLMRSLTEIETALLAHVVQLVLTEWSAQWPGRSDLRPVLVGHESSSSFLRTSAPEAMNLLVKMEVTLSEGVELLQIALPFSVIEPLLDHGASPVPHSGQESTPTQTQTTQWRSDFDDIKVSVQAEWGTVQVTARRLTHLKCGEVIPLAADHGDAVHVRLAGQLRFRGRLGEVAKRRAVELIEFLKK
jgi:flagellar motor switch protein FliM